MKHAAPAILLVALALVACRAEEADFPGTASNDALSAAPDAAMPPPDLSPAGNVSAPSPATSMVQGPESPSGYRLIGTEPFWGGTVTASEVVYNTPENQEGERIPVTAVYGPDSEVYSGTLDGRPFVLTLTAGPCSDGMSDNVHSYTVVLLVTDETRRGCANPRAE